MAFDPYLGYPTGVHMFETFDDSDISITRWLTPAIVGDTGITETGGYLDIANDGAGVAGISQLQSIHKYPRFLRASVDVRLTDGYAVADGEHAEASLCFYKDANNWIRVGPYRDTSEAINSAVYLRVCIAGTTDVTDLGAVVCDSQERVITVVLLGSEILIYIDAVYTTSFEFPSLLGYYLIIEGGTSDNTDVIHAVFDDLEVYNSFDPIILITGQRVQLIGDSPAIRDLAYEPGSGSIALSNTDDHTLEYLASSWGDVFRLALSIDISSWTTNAAVGSELHVDIYRKFAGSYSTVPFEHIVHAQADTVVEIIDIPEFLCYSDVKVVIHVDDTPTSTITLNYIENVTTEYWA